MNGAQRAARQIAAARGAFSGYEALVAVPPRQVARIGLVPREREIRWQRGVERIPGQGPVPSWRAYETHSDGRSMAGA